MIQTDGTFQNVVDLLTGSTPANGRPADQWPNIIPAQFGTMKRDGEGKLYDDHRIDPHGLIYTKAEANIECLSMIILDIDECTPEQFEMVKKRPLFPYEYLCVNSGNHMVDRGDGVGARFRIVFPLAVDIPRSSNLMRRVAAEFERRTRLVTGAPIKPDSQALKASQQYKYGYRNGEAYSWLRESKQWLEDRF
jgi:hypothetical protein